MTFNRCGVSTGKPWSLEQIMSYVLEPADSCFCLCFISGGLPNVILWISSKSQMSQITGIW